MYLQSCMCPLIHEHLDPCQCSWCWRSQLGDVPCSSEKAYNILIKICSFAHEVHTHNAARRKILFANLVPILGGTGMLYTTRVFLVGSLPSNLYYSTDIVHFWLLTNILCVLSYCLDPHCTCARLLCISLCSIQTISPRNSFTEK
jgi:hypothetical protein